jgi:hypothetical protein
MVKGGSSEPSADFQRQLASPTSIPTLPRWRGPPSGPNNSKTILNARKRNSIAERGAAVGYVDLHIYGNAYRRIDASIELANLRKFLRLA